MDPIPEQGIPPQTETPPESITPEAAKPPEKTVLTSLKSLIPPISVKTILAVLLLVVLFDYFIYQSEDGIDGVGLGVLILLTAVVIGLSECAPFSMSSLICAILMGIFALRVIWQSNALSGLIAFCLLFALASAIKKYSVHIVELIHSFYATTIRIPIMPGVIIGTLLPLGEKLPAWGQKGLRIGFVWLIPAMIVLVFMGIFAMGNLVVGNWMTEAWNWAWEQLVHIFDYLPGIGHIFFWLCAFLIALVLLVPSAVRHTILTFFLGDEETMGKPSFSLPVVDLQAAIAVNTLIAVNVLFLFYNVVDISFLWVKESLPEGLTYSTYARTGTFWLTVALALTSFILGVIFLRDLNFHRRIKTLKLLAWVWVAQNLLVALFTFQRLLIYIEFNGLTRLRIVGAYGITLVIIGLLVVALKMHRVRTFLWMVRWHLIAFALALLALAITPMDLLVWRFNRRIILYDNPRPSIQLIVQPLTAEGIPPLIPLLECKDDAIRQGVAGILLREQEQLGKLTAREKRWTDKELSRRYALKAIKAVEPRLKEILPDGNWQDAIEQLRQYTRQWY